ncbi:MAG: DUF2291 domain-containing protein [Acetobacteraceae bacterium]|nr:DUF2291 domain-containing protein [Acetobacteraceae bacterium]
MSTTTDIAGPPKARAHWGRFVLLALAIVVLAAIGWSTKVVKIGSSEDVASEVFSPERFGETEFPKIKANVEKRAVDAKTLADAIGTDKAQAAKQYGVAAGVGSVIPVSFTGVVGEGKSGVYEVAVDGVPAETKIRMQTGPAINGTDLRDATGDVKFGRFKNQIDYQNAGAGINNAMKKDALAGIDTRNLAGKTVSVVGAFTLINPKNWLVTPVEIKVQ